MTLRTPIVSVLCIAAAACTHRVDVALQPDFQTGVAADSVLAGVRPPLVVRTGSFADKRGDTTRLATFKQGMHTYNLFGERSMSEVVFEGLQQVFLKAGHQWSDSGTVRVDVTLLSLEAVRNAGFVNVGATSRVQLKVDFVDAATGRQIHSDIYNGADERSQALLGFMGMVKASIDASIINCVNTVGADRGLRDALMQWMARGSR